MERLEGHGRWPETRPLFLFVAMEYVRGRPLYTWARERPATAQQVAHVVRQLGWDVMVETEEQARERFTLKLRGDVPVKGLHPICGISSRSPDPAP